MNTRRISLWLSVAFLAIYAYFIGREFWLPLVNLPAIPGGLAVGTLVLMLLSLTHAGYLLGWRLALSFFAISAVVSWAFEQAGVATGAIYGPYHYTGMLGMKLGHVPLLIPIAWFMMIYPSYVIANLVTRGRPTVDRPSLASMAGLAFISAMVMTAWDAAMDPGMSGAGHWVWEQGGPYFGVPLQNFAGWMLTTFTVYLLYRWLERGRLPPQAADVTPWAAAIPVLAYTAMAAYYVLRGQPEGVRVVAFFSMGLPVVFAAAALLRMPHPAESAARQPEAATIQAEPGTAR
jgi:putative membrane protein